MTERDLLSSIRKIIFQETIWLRHYIGKVVDINDPQKKGRVKAIIYDLGFSDPKAGFWCYSRDKNALKTPKINEWIEIYFRNGSRDFPIYNGKASEIKDMLPKSYDGKPTTQVLFEDPEDKIHIKYDSIINSLEIGKTDLQNAARENDTIIIDATTDPVNWPLLVAAGFAGTSLNGKINSGSDQVKVGKK